MMMRRAVVAVAAFALTAGFSGCSQKDNEPFRDAPITSRNENGADIITMPDGFSNVASKCDGRGNRVFVAFHGDHFYASLAVVPDPACGGERGSR